MAETSAANRSVYAPEGAGLWGRLLKAAWLAILLGLAMEMLLIVTLALFGALPAAAPLLADTVQKVSWSFFACLGLAAGMALSKMRAAIAAVSGLLAAPLAFNIASTLHKGMAAALSLAPQTGGAFSPMFLALYKGAEYAILGGGLAWLAARSRAGLVGYAAIGLLCGAVFGGALVAMAASAPAAKLPLPRIVSLGVNEVIFPLGCSLVLYVSKIVGEHFGRDKKQPET